MLLLPSVPTPLTFLGRLRVPGDLLALGYAQLERALHQLGEKQLADEAAHKAEQERNAVRRLP